MPCPCSPRCSCSRPRITADRVRRCDRRGVRPSGARAGDALGTPDGRRLFAWARGLAHERRDVADGARSQAVACLDGAGPPALGILRGAARRAPRRRLRRRRERRRCATSRRLQRRALLRGRAVAVDRRGAVLRRHLRGRPRLRRTHPDVERPFRVPGGMTGLRVSARCRWPGRRRGGPAAVAAPDAGGIPRRPRHIPAHADRAARAAGAVRPRSRPSDAAPPRTTGSRTLPAAVAKRDSQRSHAGRPYLFWRTAAGFT